LAKAETGEGDEQVGLEITIVSGDRDFAQLRALLGEYEESLSPDLRHGSVPDIASLRATYAKPNAAFLARINDDVAGCIGLVARDEESAIVQRLYAKPSLRGQGVGRGLVATAIDFARRCGYRRVVLDTHAERLPAAYALYLSLGFSDCEAYGSVDYACPTYMELQL
jgi:putative acetyltransferase